MDWLRRNWFGMVLGAVLVLAVQGVLALASAGYLDWAGDGIGAISSVGRQITDFVVGLLVVLAVLALIFMAIRALLRNNKRARRTVRPTKPTPVDDASGEPGSDDPKLDKTEAKLASKVSSA